MKMNLLLASILAIFTLAFLVSPAEDITSEWKYVLIAIAVISVIYAVLVFFNKIPDGVFFKYDENDKMHRFVRKCVITVVSLYCFVLIWWLISIFANSVAIPTPLETFDELIVLFRDGDPTVSTHTTMWEYMFSSLRTFLLGFLVAFIVAVPLGLLIGLSKPLNEFINPMIEFIRPIAPIAWAPIFILSIGYNIGPILVVAVGIFFPLLTNTIFGVSKINPTLIDAARTLGAKKLQIFNKVVIPCSVPYVMSGMKIGLGIGWMCIIAAELYAPSLGGIGGFLSSQAYNGFWPDVYASLIMIAVLGILTTGIAEYLYKLITKRMGMQ